MTSGVAVTENMTDSLMKETGQSIAEGIGRGTVNKTEAGTAAEIETATAAAGMTALIAMIDAAGKCSGCYNRCHEQHVVLLHISQAVWLQFG